MYIDLALGRSGVRGSQHISCSNGCGISDKRDAMDVTTRFTAYGCDKIRDNLLNNIVRNGPREGWTKVNQFYEAALNGKIKSVLS